MGDEEEEEEMGKKEEEEDERGRGRQRVEISDEIRATVIDHVLVHGLTMREAGLRVQPNLS